MSDWASVEKRSQEYLSAWEYRSIYLRFGTIYERFFCPFCNIQLTAVLIYAGHDEELSRSPHFAARRGKHLGNCNGEPILEDQKKDHPPENHYEPRCIHFPEEFTNRSPPRETAQTEAENEFPPLDTLEIDYRRKRAASLGRPIPRTYILQPIVEAQRIVVSEGYDLGRTNKWDDKKRNEWTNVQLEKMPLRLEDKTSYKGAFRSTKFLVAGARRIYNGTGTVTRIEDYFRIESSLQAQVGSARLSFYVLIRADIPHGMPRWYDEVIHHLVKLSKTEHTVRWYAYGLPQKTNDGAYLELESLDYLYLIKDKHSAYKSANNDHSGK